MSQSQPMLGAMRNPSAVGLEPIRGHERSQLLAAKVAKAKNERLTCFEQCLRGTCTLVCLPLCCLGVRLTRRARARPP